MTPFFSDGDAADALYREIRDSWHDDESREARQRFREVIGDDGPDTKARIEEMWQRFQPYCADNHFLKEARKDFVSRAWEMYVACSFLEAGFRLQKPPPNGPDVLVLLGDRKLWIEAVAPRPGDADKPDTVPQASDRRIAGNLPGIWFGQSPPTEKVLLRCTSGFRDKEQKLGKYISAGIVGVTDLCVIALTTAAIEDTELCSPVVPLPARFLYGAGEAYVAVPVDSQEPITRGNLVQLELLKSNASIVRTVPFTSGEVPHVSGLVFGTQPIFRAPRRTGRDLSFFHNDQARNCLPLGLMTFVGSEWSVDPRTSRLVQSNFRRDEEATG